MYKTILIVLMIIIYGVYLLGYIKDIYAVGVLCALFGGLLSDIFKSTKINRQRKKH